MLCILELGDGVADFTGLEEELKQSGDSKSAKQRVYRYIISISNLNDTNH